MGPGGAAIREEYASEVLDRARATLGLWDFIQWTEADSIEYIVPVSYEVSRISGSRWGGLTSRWGTGEATVPNSTDGKVGAITMRNRRLMVRTTISRDLFSDATMLPKYLAYACISEFRASIEQAVLTGAVDASGGSAGPVGITQSASTVTVSTASTSGSISALDANNLWKSLYPGARERAVLDRQPILPGRVKISSRSRRAERHIHWLNTIVPENRRPSRVGRC